MSSWTYRRLLVVTMITSMIALTECGGQYPKHWQLNSSDIPDKVRVKNHILLNPAAFATVCGETQPDPAKSHCIRDRCAEKTRPESASANPLGRMFRIRVGHCGAH